MKDNDDMLRAALPRPARELSSNFSARVVAELKAHNTESRKEYTPMKFRLAPMIATIVAAVIVLVGGGVTYAATDGFTKPFNLENIFGYKTITEPNGGKVLAVQTANCTVGTVNTLSDTTDQTLYFRLKDNSTREEDVLRWLQGYCEVLSSDDAYAQLRSEQFAGSLIVDGVVTAVNGDILEITRSTKDDSTETGVIRFRIDDTTKVAKSASVGKSFVVNDTVTVASSFDENNPTATKKALLIIHQSNNTHFYTYNHEKYQVLMERVQPCGKQFCAYGSGTSTDSAEAKEAVAYVKSAYNPYQAAMLNMGMSEDWPVQLAAAHDTFYRKTTSQLAARLQTVHAGDPILCAQNVRPGTLSYGAPTAYATTVVVPVLAQEAGGYESTGSKSQEVFADVSYSLVQKKIVSIDCAHWLAQ